MLYIIEHLDGNRLYRWCFLEYKHISQIVGKNNLLFTNISSQKAKTQLLPLGRVEEKSVTQLTQLLLKKACVLDPLSDKVLEQDDKNRFDCLIFGGILGDYPPRKRTKQKLSDKLKCERRSLGDKQMATDTAVYAAKKILEGTAFERLQFQDEIELQVRKGLSIELPYRYVVDNGRVVFSEELMEFMKRKKGI